MRIDMIDFKGFPCETPPAFPVAAYLVLRLGPYDSPLNVIEKSLRIFSVKYTIEHTREYLVAICPMGFCVTTFSHCLDVGNSRTFGINLLTL